MAHEWDDMLQSLPTAYRTDQWVIDLLGAVEALDGGQRADADETAQQMFLDAMTWALAIEERVAGITPAAGSSLEERRSVLAAKWRSASGTATIEQIRAVCGSWNGVAAEVTYDGLAAITVLFRSWTDMPGNMDSVREALRGIIPAHLRFAVTAQLVRETTAGVYATVTASRRKVYPDAEVDQWHRTAEAAQYAAVTATRTKTYADIEV